MIWWWNDWILSCCVSSSLTWLLDIKWSSSSLHLRCLARNEASSLSFLINEQKIMMKSWEIEDEKKKGFMFSRFERLNSLTRLYLERLLHLWDSFFQLVWCSLPLSKYFPIFPSSSWLCQESLSFIADPQSCVWHFISTTVCFSFEILFSSIFYCKRTSRKRWSESSVGETLVSWFVISIDFVHWIIHSLTPLLVRVSEVASFDSWFFLWRRQWLNSYSVVGSESLFSRKFKDPSCLSLEASLPRDASFQTRSSLRKSLPFPCFLFIHYISCNIPGNKWLCECNIMQVVSFCATFMSQDYVREPFRETCHHEKQTKQIGLWDVMLDSWCPDASAFRFDTHRRDFHLWLLFPYDSIDQQLF